MRNSSKQLPHSHFHEAGVDEMNQFFEQRGQTKSIDSSMGTISSITYFKQET